MGTICELPSFNCIDVGGCFKNNMKKKERLKFKWNDFQRNVSKTWSQLGEFSDITLACGDFTLFPAHSAILASGGPVLRSLGTRLSHQSQALVYMQGVEARLLALLLD